MATNCLQNKFHRSVSIVTVPDLYSSTLASLSPDINPCLLVFRSQRKKTFLIYSWPGKCSNWPKLSTNGKLHATYDYYDLLTYPIMTCQCLRSSAISVVIWFLAISSFTRSRHLSFGLPRFRFPSTVICNIFLVASSLSRLCTCPNHLNLFSLRNSAIGYMCASFQMSTFLT